MSDEQIEKMFNKINDGISAIVAVLIKNEKPFYTITEAAKYLNLKVNTVYQLCASNRISYYKEGKKNYFSIKDLDEFILNKNNLIRSNYKLDELISNNTINLIK